MHICVVCSYEELEHPQYTEDGGPMFNICPCCGFQSGYHDLDREIPIDDYRKIWIEGGAVWKHQPQPKNWNKELQLRRITDKHWYEDLGATILKVFLYVRFTRNQLEESEREYFHELYSLGEKGIVMSRMGY